VGAASERLEVAAQPCRAGERVTDQRITVIARGEGDSLWVGTKKRSEPCRSETHAIERILPEPANSNALAAGYITSLLTDVRGRLWIATFGGVSTSSSRAMRTASHSCGGSGPPRDSTNDNVNKLLEDSKRNILGQYRRRAGTD